MALTGCVDVASVLRGQFQAMESIGGPLRLPGDRQRRLLLLSEDQWPSWSDFREGGPLPAQPAPPVMLQRLATATYRLASLAGRREMSAQ